MRSIIVILTSVLVLVWAAAGCGGGGGGGGTNDFGSQAEAQQAYNASLAYTTLAVSEVEAAAALAQSFTGIALGKARGSKGTANTEFIYNASTGYWEATYNEGIAGFTGTIKLRFDPSDANHLPDNTTNTMQYIVDFGYSSSEQGFDYDWSYASDMTATGIAAYRGGTGNLVIDGTTSFDIEGVYSNVYSLLYRYDISINDVTFSPTNDYPLSGTIDFTLRYEQDPESPQYPNFNISGTITFDGDNTVVVTFGGFDFVLTI